MIQEINVFEACGFPVLCYEQYEQIGADGGRASSGRTRLRPTVCRSRTRALDPKMASPLSIGKSPQASLLRLLDLWRAKAPDKFTLHYALSGVLSCIAIGLFLFMKSALFDPSPVTVAATCAIGGAFFFIRYDTTPRAFRTLLKATVALFTLYALAASNNLHPSSQGGGLEVFTSPQALRGLAVLCGILGFLRPTLGLPTFFYPVWQHALLQERFGFPVGPDRVLQPRRVRNPAGRRCRDLLPVECPTAC